MAALTKASDRRPQSNLQRQNVYRALVIDSSAGIGLPSKHRYAIRPLKILPPRWGLPTFYAPYSRGFTPGYDLPPRWGWYAVAKSIGARFTELRLSAPLPARAQARDNRFG